MLAHDSLHSRTVDVGGLLAVGAAHMLRGVGDVTGSWVAWLSPLGFAVWLHRPAILPDGRPERLACTASEALRGRRRGE